MQKNMFTFRRTAGHACKSQIFKECLIMILFQMENRELNRNCLLSVPADVAAGGNLSVRRVSDISHLNEMRHQGRKNGSILNCIMT